VPAARRRAERARQPPDADRAKWRDAGRADRSPRAWATGRRGYREAYATSHVGWGVNLDARPEAMMMYDRRDINGTELRAFAGNFLFSTGANETAGRFTACHFDYPMRGCTVELDGFKVVDAGRLTQI